MKFQVYASNTLANMESPTYTGPDGTSGTYYSTPTGESFHSSVVGRYFRCQAFLSSDSGQTTTPDFSGLRVTYAGGSGANAWSETVNTFDSRGSMTRREKTYWNGSATVTDTDVRDDASWSAGDRINNLNQVKKRIVTPAGGSATTWTFSYDANGRMTSKSDGTNTTTYVWDADEPRLLEVKLNGVTQVTYAYDSAGRMLVRTPYSGGVAQTPTRFEWDGWTCVKETTGSVVTRYIAPQGQIHSFERGGQVYQVHSDGHNGSVRAITDSTGAVVGHYEHDAWGNPLPSSSPFAGGFAYGGFCGSLGVRTDETTGLIWMRHRWFSAELGRFLSRDPLSGIGEYLYASCNPVNSIDPSGLEPWPYPGMTFMPDESQQRERELSRRRSFAKNTDCCKFAKQFGLNPAAVCAVQYHEFSFFNPVSSTEMLIVRDSEGRRQIGATLGFFGLAPSDMAQLVRNAPVKSPQNAATIQALYGNMSIQEARMMFLDPIASSQYFSAWFSQGAKPGLSPMEQADRIKRSLNPGDHWRAKLIGYNSRWNSRKEDLVSSFGKICDDEPCE